jgi:hypothetical protein
LKLSKPKHLKIFQLSMDFQCPLKTNINVLVLEILQDMQLVFIENQLIIIQLLFRF